MAINGSDPSFVGTGAPDFLFGAGIGGVNVDSTIYGLGGNDYIVGDTSFNTTEPNPDVGGPIGSFSVPYQSSGGILPGTLQLEAGQTVTIDIDYADNFGGALDLELIILLGPTVVARTEDMTGDPDRGSWSTKDPLLTFTAPSAGSYTMAIGRQLAGDSGGYADLGILPLLAGDALLINLSPGDVIPGSTITPGAGNDMLFGGAGNDAVRGMGGDDTAYGGTGNDDVDGGLGNDILYGDDGDDTVTGFDGADLIEGGAGHDLIRGENGKDTASGGEGRDTMFGNNGRDVLNGNGWNDELYGQSAADRLFGGVGKDTVNGGGGDDVLRGGDGRDRMIGGDGDDVLHGDSGEDLQFGRDGDDILNGNANDDRLNGQAGEDRLFGGGGDDTITGGGDDDFLKGGEGDDRLNGGDGDDTLEGGNGADAFVFKNIIGGQRDVVEDFQDGLDTLVFKSGTVSYQAHAQGVLVTTQNGFEVLVKGWSYGDVDSGDFDFI